MKISYINTVEDLVSFNKKAKSNYNKNIKVIFTSIVPLITILYLIYDYLYFDQGISSFSIGAFIFCLLWIILYPKLLDITYKKRLISKLDTINFEPLTLELSEEGLTKISSSSNHKFEWKSVDNIITTKDHIFIYLNTNNGLAISLSSFSSSIETQSFIKYLYDHLNNSSKY
ncbi:YcxB family protein [Clostridium sp. YIM B02505]|uniref:YcxB family protein n=1 Tax=Clostridium yunnanense TaxID=2800325 RepID=A0ABS1EMF5_9CLOT|nr:YcxB family protein [Clostridium yunnanense]MBK1810537.1 YcxB family protein [Clostridium yunnanense]